MGLRSALAALVAAGALAGCALPAGTAQQDYRALIKQSLDYRPGDRRTFSITAPWAALTGSTMVCVREDVPDGKGGRAPSDDYTMYEIADGRVMQAVKDRTLLGCVNRSYSAFLPG